AARLERAAGELVALGVQREGVIGHDRAVGGVVGGVDADLDAAADARRATDRKPGAAAGVLTPDRGAVGDDTHLDHGREPGRERGCEVRALEPWLLVSGEDVLEAGATYPFVDKD